MSYSTPRNFQLSAKKQMLLEALRKQKGLEDSPVQKIPRRESHSAPRLSYAQKRLWFLGQLEPENVAYNNAAAIRLSGNLNVAALEQSINQVIERHEVLRTTFASYDGDPVQIIAARLKMSMPVIDLQRYTKESREDAVSRLAQEQVREPFDLSKGPLLRVGLLRLDESEHVLILTMHHIICDGWSRSVFVRELAAHYTALLDGRQAQLPDLPIQYADYAEWQRQTLQGETLETQMAYWKKQLGGKLSPLELLTDRPRPAVETYEGAVTRFSLTKELTQALNDLAQQNGATLFMILLAAFDTLLVRYTGQKDVSVGTPIANRNHSQIEPLIGYFANTIVLRTRANPDMSFSDLLSQVRNLTLEAYAHQDLPFEKLIEELQPERDMSRNPLFQVMFALQNTPASTLELPQLKITPLEIDSGASVFDLTLLMSEEAGCLAGALEYNTDLFHDSTADRMARHFQNLLESITIDPAQPLLKLPMLSEAERDRILFEWNDTKADFNIDRCIHHLIEEQAAKTPGAIAVVFRERRLTYEELNRRANNLAHYLRKFGVGPETLVGICVERSVEMVVGLLAVIKAGGAAIALDPSYPKDRLEFMIRDAHGPVLLTEQRLRDFLPDTHINKLCLDSQWAEMERENDGNPVTEVTAENLLYGIYTSGSTGMPKGIGMTHKAFLNLLEWQHRHPSLSATAKTVQFATFGFCVSFQEIFSTWCSGGTIALIADDSRRDMEALADLLQDEQIERLYLPFASLKNLAEVCTSTKELPSSLREFITAGEQLQVTDQIRALFERIDGGVLHNHYGASETHVVSSFTLSGPPGAWPDIPPSGRPIANVQIYLLDSRLQPVPVGVAGEIYVGGVCLARSYFNDAELTAEKFIPDPFGHEPGARLYRTGDLARYFADGNIAYLGRADQQLKIRGFRVEPGEVEVVLRQHRDVLDAAVVPQEDYRGNKKLVAYIVWETRGQIGEVRDFLKSKLPEYMLPAAFIPLASLPVSANGKLDRQALPVSEQLEPQSKEDYLAPRTAAEEILAAIYAEVLGIKRIGASDNFFELGGHSLLATQLVSRVRKAFQIDLPLKRLFESPTVESLAERINAALCAGEVFKAPPIERAPRDRASALSFAQQRLWFLDTLEPGNPFYNVPSAILIKGSLDVAALRQSLNEIIERHEALRTTFTAIEGKPTQAINEDARVPLPVVDLRSMRESEREIESKRLTLEEGQQPFDLSRGPLVRAGLLRLSDDTHILLLTFHHIVFDGWSGRVLVAELGALYNSLKVGGAASLPRLDIQYSDFAQWQREWMQGEVLASQLSYWKQQLDSFSRLDLPTDFRRPEVESFRGARQSFLVARELAHSLKELSRREGVTLFMLLLAAFDALLHRYSGQEDIVVGTPIANRNRAEIEGLIGVFVNTLAIRVNISGSQSFRELLMRVRDTALGAYAHQDLPFEKLVEELHLDRSANRNPVFQVMFVLHNTPMPPLELAGLTLSPLDVETGTAKFDLTLSMMETDEGLIGSLEYNTDLFKQSTIKQMVERFEMLLESISNNPEQRVDSLPLSTERETRQLLIDWNQTLRDYPHGLCINQLFEQQVEHDPDAIAVVFGDQKLTYREINERANQLSHHLLSLGSGPEALIALYLERSVEMIVALLAIAKAGGAYVPLDTTYPLERIAFVLEETQAPVILTQDSLVYDLPASWAQIICLDSDWEQVAAQSVENPANSATPDNLAYVIYTSGSTGQPKGVCVTHRNVARLVKGNYFADLSAEQVFLQLAPISFDASTFEVWGALLNGARLVVMPPELPTLAEIGSVLKEFEVTTLWLTAGLFHLVVDERLDDLKGLRQLLAGGDVLSASHVKRALQHLDGCTVINGYGPTEGTTFTCCHRMNSADDLSSSSVPIGRPIANTQVYILDRFMRPLPAGIIGELYIGGDGLARNYLNRPELTAEKFVPNPFSPEPGRRLYKTGDLCRCLADGEIEFAGRSDYQVKIRGYRVEPGEIEAALNQFAMIRESVVIASGKSSGDKRLIAYLVPRAEASFTSTDVQSYLKDKLPDYMIPAQFVVLDSLPLTSNGKVDRDSLPSPDQSEANLQPAFVAPRTDTEELLAGIWGEVLQLEKVSIEDNFFHMGGQSLTAIQVISRVRDLFQIEVRLHCLFESPTVSGFAEAMLEFEQTPGQVASVARLRKQVNEMAPGEVRARINEEKLAPENDL